MENCPLLADTQYCNINIDTRWREGVTEGRGEGLEIGPGSDCDQISYYPGTESHHP